VGAVALTPAEAHPRALHQRPLRPRRTLQLLPLAAVVEAAARTEAFIISEIPEKTAPRLGAVFRF